MSEPPMKKQKKGNEVHILISRAIEVCINEMKQNTKNLQPILSDDFFKPVPLMKVYVGVVKNLQNMSKIITILNEKIPLKNLMHLKRAKKKDVILCPSTFLNDVSSIQEYLDVHVEEVKEMFDYFKEVSVPSVAPKTRQQVSSQMWSLNFHTNKYYEKLVGDNFFSPPDLARHVSFMQMAFEVARWHLQRDDSLEVVPNILTEINAIIIVDPVINSVVATSFCGINHPVQHATMLAIDNVAKTQNGGVYGLEYGTENIDQSLKGIDKDLLIELKYLFRKPNYGARPYKSKRDAGDNSEVNDLEDMKATEENTSGDGPYLCTGYYVYMLREPCFMCAMALVHARANRVFFCYPNEKFGALMSRTKLQEISSLNHHFEVFTGFI